MRDPIIVLGIPRSGTSMVAGLFAAHGVWVGECKKPTRMNPKGFFENVGIRALIRPRWGSHQTEAMRLLEPIDGWRELVEAEIRRQGYTGGPWLVKHSAVGWPIWHEFSPRYVCVRRDNVDKSFAAWFRATPEAVRFSQAQLDTVRDEHGGVDVFSDEIIEGNYTSLIRAFDRCGLEFDPRIADDFVEPELWHY